MGVCVSLELERRLRDQDLLVPVSEALALGPGRVAQGQAAWVALLVSVLSKVIWAVICGTNFGREVLGLGAI